MYFTDFAPVSGIHRTANGYLAADARVARTGIQTYSGAECGRPEMREVRVLRPDSEVFSHAAMASAAHRPITLDHPSEAVSPANWKKHSVGWTGDTVARDGEFLKIPMMLADQTVIDAMQSGAREISCGYSCDLEWGDGVTPDGLAYHAKQRAISINHIAVVLKGRAGSECRIGDSAMTYSSSLDRQTADHNSFLRMTGRTTPVHVTDRVREVADQIAREAEQKRLRNNAYVDSLVTDRRVQTAAMIESSGVSGSGDVARAVRDSALDGARAVRDLARLGVYS